MVNGGVDGEGDVVSETVDGAAEKIESGTKVGDSGRSECLHGGEYGFGFGYGYMDGCGGNREVAAQRVGFESG